MPCFFYRAVNAFRFNKGTNNQLERKSFYYTMVEISDNTFCGRYFIPILVRKKVDFDRPELYYTPLHN